MKREEAIRIIVRATQWLTTSPATHSGRQEGNEYIVEEVAQTRDRGVSFHHYEKYLSDGKLHVTSSIYLKDDADPDSWHDSVPVTAAPSSDNLKLWLGKTKAIRISALRLLSLEKLTRMARNATRILQDYGQTPQH